MVERGGGDGVRFDAVECVDGWTLSLLLLTCEDLKILHDFWILCVAGKRGSCVCVYVREMRV